MAFLNLNFTHYKKVKLVKGLMEEQYGSEHNYIHRKKSINVTFIIIAPICYS